MTVPSSINTVQLSASDPRREQGTHICTHVAPRPLCFPVPFQNNKTSVFACIKASWVLSQMVLMTCAPAETASSFVLDWWHMLSYRAINRARQPPVSERHPCNPSATATQWQRQTLNKQRASFSPHCISICFFLTPPPPPSVCCCLSLLLHPPLWCSSLFSLFLMSPLSPTWWMTLCFSD